MTTTNRVGGLYRFTLLDEGAIPHSSERNHVLAIIKERESYESLYIALEDIRSEIQSVSSIEMCRSSVRCHYLGGD